MVKPCRIVVTWNINHEVNDDEIPPIDKGLQMRERVKYWKEIADVLPCDFICCSDRDRVCVMKVLLKTQLSTWIFRLLGNVSLSYCLNLTKVHDLTKCA